MKNFKIRTEPSGVAAVSRTSGKDGKIVINNDNQEDDVDLDYSDLHW
jgi:hypothetical protein